MTNLVSQTPIIKQAFYFLQNASAGIKLTEKGALGRNLVQSFWDMFIKTPESERFRPTREFECPEISRLHFLLSESKYVRKYKGKVCLTEKGKSVLKWSHLDELYYDLLSVGIYGWNWGFEDRYPDYEFIQQNGEILVQKVLKSPFRKVTAEQIFNESFGPQIERLDDEEKKYLYHCFTVRFFHRFCVPFGILKDEQDWFLNKKHNEPFEKTEFFISEFTDVLRRGEAIKGQS